MGGQQLVCSLKMVVFFGRCCGLRHEGFFWEETVTMVVLAFVFLNLMYVSTGFLFLDLNGSSLP